MDEDIELNKFSDCFWKFIREKVGIKKVNFNLSQKGSPSKIKKVFNFNSVYDELQTKLQKVHFENDHLDKEDVELTKW